MTKEQYFNELYGCLNKLSQEEINEAMNFYKEYSDEAGFDTYEEMSEHFGTPQNLASKIYADTAVKIMKNPYKKSDSKKNSVGKGFLIGLAALFSLPLTFPLAIVALTLLFVLTVAIISVIFAIGFAIFAIGAAGISIFFLSFRYIIPFMPTTWLQMFGAGLFLIGITIGLLWLAFLAVKYILEFTTLLISKIVNRRINHE